MLTEFAWHLARGVSSVRMDKSACCRGVFCRVREPVVPILKEGMHIRRFIPCETRQLRRAIYTM